LGAGLLGVLLLLGGLAWDAVLHARDPDTAHVETSLFTLANPAHGVLVAGGVLVIASVTTAIVRALRLARTPWLSSRATAIAVVAAVVGGSVATAGALRAASLAEPRIATGPLAPAPGPEHHGIGVLNSHATGECRPTKAQTAAAAKLVADTKAATAPYASLETAIAAGFGGPISPGSGKTEHFGNLANLTDGKVLDPAHPEALLYTFTARGPVLIGVMYLMNQPGEFGPEIGGCLTRWHVHTNVCWSATTLQAVGELKPGEACGEGTFHYIPPPALHVWLADVPGGRFAAEVDPGTLLQIASRL
jgi:hypothetical protein